MMDGERHFCESCGCTCDCGRDTDYDTCDFCTECINAEDAYEDFYFDHWEEE